MDQERLQVPVESLTPVCHPEELPFETTEELPPLEGTVGQERAVTALEFGLNIRSLGYNIFVAGLPGTGRNTTLANYLQRAAEAMPLPDDWCYVHNFDDPTRPQAVALPAGMGSELERDLAELLAACQRSVPRAFEGPEYQQRVQEVLEEVNALRSRLTTEMEQEARREGFTLQFTPMGIATILLSEEGKPMEREAFERLPEDRQGLLRETRERVQAMVQEKVAALRLLDKSADQHRAEVDRGVAEFTVRPHVAELQGKYSRFPRVVAYLERVMSDMVDHLDDFRPGAQDGDIPPQMRQSVMEQRFQRYRTNVVISNRGARAAPVVFEYSPTYYNLFGRIEYRTTMGGASTDLTMIRPGSVHRANGGFLVCQARDLLGFPTCWDTMKRMLRSREARIENLGDQFSPVPFSTLSPEPIPVNTKIVLVGSPLLYRLLQLYDDDFHKFFKVKADFDVSMERTPENIQRYASFIVNRVREEGLRHFDRGAVARLVEHSCRLVQDQSRLTTRFADVADLVTEANFWAEHDNGSPVIRAEHVDRAVREKVYRSNLPEERLRDLIRDGTIHVLTEGAVVGQVNGLSVVELGDYAFGVPGQVTARTALGRGEVANIEHETQMGGRIHNKGFMTLVGYLMGKFGKDKPVPVRASIGFEQMYSEVEGDSASSTQLYALLSSLAEAPVRQDLAVTGSVSQLGQVQAVGGVTPKIEGFFDVCRLNGLTGTQGVIIPRDNVKNLVLRQDVVEAVEAGRFHIYAAATVEEGIELLTGVPAGEQQSGGGYSEGTLFGRVDAALRALAEKARQQAAALGQGNGRRARRSGERRDGGAGGGDPS